jgi:hypothetical protein
MTAEALLKRCHELGVIVALSPEGKLRATPPGRLPEDLKAQIRQHKAEVLAVLRSWPCPHCGQPAEIEAVEPRRDDGVLLTYWHCEACQVWAVTPDTLQQPPVWVSSKEQ